MSGAIRQRTPPRCRICDHERRRHHMALLVVVVLFASAGCVDQAVKTPDTLHIVTGNASTPAAWKPADQDAAVAWLAAHPLKVGRNRYYGIVMASGMQGDNWAAAIVQPSGEPMLIIDGGHADDLLIQRGDAIEAHAYGDGQLMDDPPTLITKQAVTLS